MKNILSIIIFSVFFIGGYFLIQFYQKKAEENFLREEAIAELEDKIPAQCENGEWTEFPDEEKRETFLEFKANDRIKMNNNEFLSQDGSLHFTTHKDYALTFFVERDVRIEGFDMNSENKREIYVKKIKCVGVEADPVKRVERRSLMKYIADNINSLAIEKNKNSQWQVGTFYFVSDTDLYVEYESSSSIREEAPYDAKLWLIRASNLDRDIPHIESLAYISEDPEDPQKDVVKMGEDLYRNQDNMSVYEYSDESKDWVLQ